MVVFSSGHRVITTKEALFGRIGVSLRGESGGVRRRCVLERVGNKCGQR